jgi:hypothetical protein
MISELVWPKRNCVRPLTARAGGSSGAAPPCFARAEARPGVSRGVGRRRERGALGLAARGGAGGHLARGRLWGVTALQRGACRSRGCDSRSQGPGGTRCPDARASRRHARAAPERSSASTGWGLRWRRWAWCGSCPPWPRSSSMCTGAGNDPVQWPPFLPPALKALHIDGSFAWS